MSKQNISGRNPVLEILKSEREIEKIYVLKGDLKGSIKKILGMARDKKIIIQEVDKNKMESLSGGESHQGVVAIVSDYEYSQVEDILELARRREEDPFVVILDEIEDPYNLGSIIRSAECAGVHGIIIPKRRSASVNSTVYKSSAGAVEHMMVAKVTNISNTIEDLKKKGLWIYGADMDGEDYHFKTNLGGPIGLVIGSEGKGISRLVKEKCDVLVKIPLKGKISSLNASNASSILIYEIVRQRHES